VAADADAARSLLMLLTLAVRLHAPSTAYLQVHIRPTSRRGRPSLRRRLFGIDRSINTVRTD